MTIEELRSKVVAELKSRNLKDPSIRERALNHVLSFIKGRNSYISNGELNLPSDINRLKSEYETYKGQKLNSAESSVINTMYDEYVGSPSINVKEIEGQQNSLSSQNEVETEVSKDDTEQSNDEFVLSTKETDSSMCVSNSNKDSEELSCEIENKLIKGAFKPVSELDNGKCVPSVPGIYCIRLREGVSFPEDYGKIREDGIIYIGIATKSLHERLWKEELNHIKSATFFRSMGAILKYLPVKGSLVGKKNNKNYKFCEKDTNAIIEWMRQSLQVNFVPVTVAKDILEEIEKSLIKKYSPIVNIEHNDNRSQKLKEARRKCREWANTK